ncbi:MAG: PIN domain nuclease [Actinomycetota bacterium]|nr:PIN domain nuclease [Actinomycetota bacterium]
MPGHEQSWLIDKSALVRLGLCSDSELWANRIERGLVVVSSVTLLEAGFSARSALDLAQALASPPLASMPVEYLSPAVEDRAVAVQRLLAERGLHRAPSIPDLLIAATAELNRRVVLHYDKDFDLIAEITFQSVEWLRIH